MKKRLLFSAMAVAAMAFAGYSVYSTGDSQAACSLTSADVEAVASPEPEVNRFNPTPYRQLCCTKWEFVTINGILEKKCTHEEYFAGLICPAGNYAPTCTLDSPC